MNQKINIQGVPETMLQTLYARAKESQKENHKIYDQKAIEIVSKLDYDFSLADKDFKMGAGVIARTIILDRLVKDYIQAHENATIVNIACGLDTRFYRVDNGKIRWYNLDLPMTIDMRKMFLKEDGRVSMIAKSAMDESWKDEIEKTHQPILFIIEGLTMYLTQADVQKIFSIIHSFDNVTVFVETMSPMFVKTVKEKSIEQSQAKFSWGIKNGQKFVQIIEGFRHIKDISLVEGMKEMYAFYKLIGWIPVVKNISNKIIVLEK